MKHVAILGSTGSIGTQALQVIAAHPERFRVEVLTAHRDAEGLARQAARFKPNMVVIADETKHGELKALLRDEDIKVYAGSDAIAQAVEARPVDVVLTAMVGYSGLAPTISAIRAGKTIALANKETLVVAGELISRLAASHRAAILPVDSEHSAIFQCLAGEGDNPVEKLILTASGGPFRGKDSAFLRGVTPEQALQHPTWNMGAKVTIDSATLMNKGFEVIEARWLFGVAPGQIEVLVHPQSIIHSMVQFADGSIKAQLGAPDMRLPIQHALSYPDRLASDLPRVDFDACRALTFERPEAGAFPCLGLAFEATRRGGNIPCAMNAANEVAVEAFLGGRLPFTGIPAIIEQTIDKITRVASPSLEDYAATDGVARRLAREQL
ncbi:MAG: 1-deoxy-D-xylulose-5-phosphate reductoisomerase [Odoribacteraceae bacterium]|jgi:1-deoxy-D-xylulose-5-phosphate reductoisomerase|nr:1-deoxy-D-xylulose-5-phosphate reductoisomerase [Odoribacteraceae bacterium]